MDAQNLSNDFQAGEFAQPSLLSPVATIETATNGKLPIDDSLLSDAVESFLALELVNTDSMIINSYFHCWGLGKTDLSQYSEFYQSQIRAINLPSDLVHSPLNDSLNQGGVTLGKIVCEYHLDNCKTSETRIITFTSDSTINDASISELMDECQAKAMILSIFLIF